MVVMRQTKSIAQLVTHAAVFSVRGNATQLELEPPPMLRAQQVTSLGARKASDPRECNTVHAASGVTRH
jgi:hypothetical protein